MANKHVNRGMAVE